jgi:predicted N-acetyltransferase YhbS
MADYLHEPLTGAHLIDDFDCGKEPLNEWLHKSALRSQRANTASTFVLIRAGQVVGYYSLCMHSLEKHDLPKSVGKDGPNNVPAVLLARLARDNTVRGEGIGDLLMAEAFRTAVAATEHAAARVMVVDVIDEDAAKFYERHGFKRSESSPNRLAAKVASIKATLAELDKNS